MKKNAVTGISVLFLVIQLTVHTTAHAQTTLLSIPASFTFQTNLKYGSNVDPDVKYLQYLLDKDPNTAVALSGSGSANELTSFFGSKTKDAVRRFQELYAGDILNPIGLTQGNGFVGPRTIAKLNSMIKDATTTSVSIKTKTTEKITPSASGPISTTTSLLLSPRFSNGIIPQHSAFVPIFDNEILIYGLSHIKVRPGDWVGVVGYGFDSNTVFHIGPTISVPISATSSTDFSFQVPNIPYDTYEVWVTNATSSSQKRSPVQLVVGSITDIRPSILSVTPEIASQGDTIKVTAEKLDNYGNTIYSSLGIIKNVPSPDGHSLTFKVFDLPRTTAFLQSKTMDQMIVSFGIGTMGTRSLNYGYFYISK